MGCPTAEFITPEDGAEKQDCERAAAKGWLADMPLRDSKDAVAVTWFSIEISDAKGKPSYANSFVTDSP
ncbi:MAG: hypothetical protein GC191_06465 [Azospirillum sp.]|nr:hypothetical protein [Azospirillum sp.]